MRITIIGAGNVGTNLHHILLQKNIRAELISSRDEEKLTSLSDADGQGKVFIYTVADAALKEVITRVNAPKALHIHTSGTMPIEVFGADKTHAAIMYCFQSFSKQKMIEDWTQIPIFVEGKNIDDLAAVYSLALTLTDRVYEAKQHEREKLHIAGVFANNFTNLMYNMAAELLKNTTIPFAALLPLIDQTAQKIHTLTPQDAQTGPAQRGDENIMNHHLQVLESTPEKQQIYKILSEAIRNR